MRQFWGNAVSHSPAGKDVLSFITSSNAQTCPDYYRFVDFGLEDDSGVMYRGGTLLRAEGFSADL